MSIPDSNFSIKYLFSFCSWLNQMTKLTILCNIYWLRPLYTHCLKSRLMTNLITYTRHSKSDMTWRHSLHILLVGHVGKHVTYCSEGLYFEDSKIFLLSLCFPLTFSDLLLRLNKRCRTKFKAFPSLVPPRGYLILLMVRCTLALFVPR